MGDYILNYVYMIITISLIYVCDPSITGNQRVINSQYEQIYTEPTAIQLYTCIYIYCYCYLFFLFGGVLLSHPGT